MLLVPGEKLYTTWMTSTNGVDHAITDEAFTAQRPEPETVCGKVVYLAPMETPPGPRCAQCTAFLAARESLRDLPQTPWRTATAQTAVPVGASAAHSVSGGRAGRPVHVP